MAKGTTDGFALLDVVVALGVLAISTLAIAGALGAALEYQHAARAARRGVAVAAAVVHTFDDDADYPAGWRAAGTHGADLLPATRDDGPPIAPATACRRRVVSTARGVQRWIWVEARCPVGAGERGASSGPHAGTTVLLRGR